MEYPILLATIRALRPRLVGTAVAEIRQDGFRFRLVFVAADGSPRSILLSIDPQRPWIGRPVSRAARRPRHASRFESVLRRTLGGVILRDLLLSDGDRIVTLRFADGHDLVAHLVRHRANLRLLGADAALVAEARLLAPTRGSRPRLDDPDALVPAEELGQLAEGAIEPVLLAPVDPRRIAEHEEVARDSLRLLPWPPPSPPAGLEAFRGVDAAETVGLFHEALDEIEARSSRRRAIARALGAEEQRVRRAIDRVRDDLSRFEDAERHRRHGEALLAGITRAIRLGDRVRVPDPWVASGAEIEIPIVPGRTLAESATECFRRHRRAARGREQATSRLAGLEDRLGRLRGVAEQLAVETRAATAAAEEGLRQLGILLESPVDSSGRRPARDARAAGVRVFVAPGGETVLAGRSGVGNERVTFRLAAPDDIWLHASGSAGAHVILRRLPGRGEPDRESLQYAARIAAWFSEARNAAAVDVQWTRRRLVRRRRGGAAGSVLVKRFQVIRVQPAAPQEVDDSR